jgi:hypothetical protein
MMQGLGVKLDEKSPVRKLENTLKEMKEWKGMYETFHPFGSVDA